MSRSGKYTVAGFMQDAKRILETELPLAEKQAEIADRMSLLSQRDDLTRFAIPIGPADGSTQNFLLGWCQSCANCSPLGSLRSLKLAA